MDHETLFEQIVADAFITQMASWDHAAALGANAVVGVDLDYEVINNMLMVSASGTAVRLG